MMRMMRKELCLFAVVVFCLCCLSSCVSAGECRYGAVQAWFVQPGKVMNATAHPPLRRGEVFTVRTVVTLSSSLEVVFVKLHEFGTPVYEVLAGPCVLEQLFECRDDLLPNQTFSYQWTLRVLPDTTWVNGNAPLEVFVQFNRNEAESCVVSFDVVNAYILPQIVNGSAQDDSFQNQSIDTAGRTGTPGFASGELLVGVVMVVWCLRKRRHLK